MSETKRNQPIANELTAAPVAGVSASVKQAAFWFDEGNSQCQRQQVLTWLAENVPQPRLQGLQTANLLVVFLTGCCRLGSVFLGRFRVILEDKPCFDDCTNTTICQM